MDPLLEVKNLHTEFTTDEGSFFAVEDVSFVVEKGKVLGIVGESGCGKSVTSLSVLRLIQKPGRIRSGQVLFHGKNLLDLSEPEMRSIRGGKISMIFQEPMTSLNPVFTIGNQIDEAIRVHMQGLTSAEVQSRSIEILRKVGIPAPEKRYHDFPHQLSGGMRQRVMIAIAMSCDPELLIADEPTTALDVTIQAQILDLIRKLQADTKASVLLITHDLGVVAEMCHDVMVMYAGKIVEYGSVEDIFYRPRHPYTKGLIDAVPRGSEIVRSTKNDPLATIKGMVPSLLNLPKGCRFADRCSYAQKTCFDSYPQQTKLRGSHRVSCYFPLENQPGAMSNE